MRDKNKTYIRLAMNVAKGLIKEQAVRSSLSLAEYQVWKRDYLEPIRGINTLPIILAKLDALSKSKSIVERDVSALAEEVGKWNEWMRMVSKWKSQLEGFEDNPMDPIAIKLSNEIEQADDIINRKSAAMSMKQHKLDNLNSQIHSMSEIISEADGYKFLAIMGII